MLGLLDNKQIEEVLTQQNQVFIGVIKITLKTKIPL